MKKMIMCLLTAMLLTASAGAVDLYVDMAKIETDTPPTLVGGRTLVPLRAIFEAIGANVEWDNDTRTATGKDRRCGQYIKGAEFLRDQNRRTLPLQQHLQWWDLL